MIKESRTKIAIPPGYALEEYLQLHNIKQKEFALKLGISEKHLCKLISGDVILNTDMAIKLEKVSGVSGNIWMGLEYEYRKELQIIEDENNMDDDLEVLNKFPVNEMEKLGIIPKANKKTEKVHNLRNFFQVVKLTYLFDEKFPIILGCNERSTRKIEYNLIVLAQYAKLQAYNIKTEKINVNKIEKSLDEILNFKENNNYLEELPRYLSDLGIAFILLPKISNTIHGITFNDNKKIVLGVVYEEDREKFFYYLFHELGHIILGHLKEKKEKNKDADLFAQQFIKKRY